MSELSVSNLGVTKTNIVAELNESEDGDDSSKAFERQTTEQQNLGSIHIAAVDSQQQLSSQEEANASRLEIISQLD